MIDFDIKLTPDLSEVKSDLERSLEDATKRIFRELATDAPLEMQSLIGSPPPSAKGSPPARRSGNLQRSLRGTLTSPQSAEIEMADYAQYLDPVFDGYLERPFIEISIARTLKKTLVDLQ